MYIDKDFKSPKSMSMLNYLHFYFSDKTAEANLAPLILEWHRLRYKDSPVLFLHIKSHLATDQGSTREQTETIIRAVLIGGTFTLAKAGGMKFVGLQDPLRFYLDVVRFSALL